MRVTVLEFLDTDIFNVSVKHCDMFLDRLIESWDIDLATLAMEVVPNTRLAYVSPKELGFFERETGRRTEEAPGINRFLANRSPSWDASAGEMGFSLYCYRELRQLTNPRYVRMSVFPAPQQEMLRTVPSANRLLSPCRNTSRVAVSRSRCRPTAERRRSNAGRETRAKEIGSGIKAGELSCNASCQRKPGAKWLIPSCSISDLK